jgi:Secretion system C-terminal sorting domain
MVMKRRPAAMKFKMNYLTSVSTESFFAFITFFQSNDGKRDTLLTDIVALSQRGPLLGSVAANKIGWLQISKPINYASWDENFLGAVSDSCTVEFFSTGNMASGTSATTLSTELMLDDVEFTSWGTGLETTVTAVEQSDLSNYPNPFSSVTAINYSLAIPSSNTNLTVIDINGKQVFTKDLGKQAAGDFTVNFDGSDLNSGVYFYTLTSDNNRQTGKMLISK